MAADATELAVAYISLLPSLQGFQGAVEKEIGGLGVNLGKGFGADFARAAQQSSGPDIKKLAAQLDAARSQEADAAGKARVAEAKLNEVRAKGKAGTAQAVAAEENFAKASRELERAQKGSQAAASKHAAASKDVAAGADKAGDQLDDYRRAANRADNAVEKTAKKSKESGKTIRGSFGGLGKLFAPLAAIAGGTALVDFFKDAGGAASDMGEIQSKNNQIFGKDGAEALNKFAEGADTRLGQTQQSVLDAAGTFGVFGKAAGLGGKDLAGFSSDFVALSSDLASFHNADPSEVIEAIGSGLRGEAEPLRKYGVLLDDASLRQEALKQGLIKTTKDALTPQQKVLAAQALIMKQTKDAQGDFAKTSGGLANQQRIAAASAAEVKRQFGELLLPAFLWGTKIVNQNVIPALRSLVTWISAGGGPIKEIIGGFRAFGASVKIADGDITSSGFPGLMERIGGFVALTLIPAFRGFVGVLQRDVVPGFMAVGAAFMGYIAVVLPIIRSIVGAFVNEWPKIAPVVMSIFNTVKNIVVDVLSFIASYIKGVTAVINFIWSRWGGQITKVVVGAFKLVVSVIAGAFKVISGLVKVVTGVLTGDWKKAGSGLKLIASGIGQMFKAQFTFIRDVVNSLIKDAITWLKSKWSGFTGWVAGTLAAKLAKIQGYISGPVSKAKTAIDEILGKIKGAFSGAVTRIGTIWDGLKAKAKSPIKFIVNTVINDGLIGAFNKVAGAVGAGKIARVGLPKGFASGGFTGWMGRKQEAGVVHGREYVFDAKTVEKAGGPSVFDRWRAAIKGNKPGDAGVPGYGIGGYVKALSFAKKQRGKPYVFGSAGPGGFDCSGFMAAIQNVIEGKGAYRRRYSTPAFHGSSAQGFVRGAKSAFTVGVNPAPGKSGHMAGTLLGTNVESSGGVGVRVGGGARGTGAGMFSWRGGHKGGLGIGGKLGAFIKSGFDSVVAWFKNLVGGSLGKLKDAGSSPWADIVKKLPGKIVSGMTDKFNKYETGTSSARPGMALVGENGPEFVNFRGGETVMPNGTVASGALIGGSVTFVSSGSMRSDLDEVMFELRRRAGGGR